MLSDSIASGFATIHALSIVVLLALLRFAHVEIRHSGRWEFLIPKIFISSNRRTDEAREVKAKPAFGSASRNDDVFSNEEDSVK